jgi:eukaryotic-like serine/threonine-protein kinase
MGLCPVCLLGLAEEVPTVLETGGEPRAGNPSDGSGSGRSGQYFQGFELLGEIARGGMGVVYRARQASLSREVALKMILGGRLASEADVARFRAEAKAAAGLQHPNIVAIHEIGEHAGQHYFSMDYVPGSNLAALARGEPLASDRAAGYVRKIARAVHYAHSRGVIHRDLKPQNVLIDSEDEPRITDFGLAKQVGMESGLTLTGAVLGSPSYMAPEQAQGHPDQVGARSDVYAIGAILYELLTGRPPFRAATLTETLRQVVDSEPATPRSLNPGIEPDLDTICLKCLEKDPASRYGSAQEVADELDRFLNQKPILARRATLKERGIKWIKRNPRVAVLWGVVAATALAGLCGVLFQLRQTKAALRQSNLNAIAEVTARAPELAPKLTLRHQGPVLTAVFDRSGRRILSASHDKTARVWDAADGMPLLELKGHAGVVGGAEFSPDEQSVLTFSFDTQFRFPNLSPVGEHQVTEHYPVYSDRTARIWDVASGKERIVMDHNDQVADARFSPDGRFVATAGWDHVARIWNVETGTELHQLRGHAASLLSVSFTPDSKRLATGTEGYRYSYTLGPGGAGGSSTTVREPVLATIWNVVDGQTMVQVKNQISRPLEALIGAGGYSASRARVAFSPDGRYLVTAAQDPERAAVWNVEDGGPIAWLKGHTYEVNVACFSPSGDRVVTASADHSARIWDATSGREIAVLLAHSGPVLWAEFSPDGRWVVTASADTTVRVWDAATGRGLAVMKGHQDKVYQAHFSPDNLRVVSASADGTVRLWDAATMDQLSIKLEGHQGEVTGLTFSPDSRHVATGSGDKTARVWVVATGAEVQVLKGHSNIRKRQLRNDILGRVNAVAFSPDGKRLLTGAEDEHRLLANGIKNGKPNIVGDIPFTPARIWDLTDGSEQFGLLGHECGVGAVAYSPDGTLALSASDGVIRQKSIARRFLTRLSSGGGGSKKGATYVRVWDTRTGKQVHLLGGHSQAVGIARFSPDGTRIVTADRASVVQVWDTRTGRLQTELDGESRALQVQFTPDSQRLFVNPGGVPGIWSVETGKRILSLENHRTTTLFGVLGPLGGVVVSCLQDGSILISDPETGRTKSRMTQPGSGIAFAVISPDERWVATFANDNVARIWDVESGRSLAVFEGHTRRITCAAISPDGKWLGTGSDDYTARLWPMDAITSR